MSYNVLIRIILNMLVQISKMCSLFHLKLIYFFQQLNSYQFSVVRTILGLPKSDVFLFNVYVSSFWKIRVNYTKTFDCVCEVIPNKAGKSMLIAFDIKGIIHKDFVPPGQTVNGKFYFDSATRENINKNVEEQDLGSTLPHR